MSYKVSFLRKTRNFREKTRNFREKTRNFRFFLRKTRKNRESFFFFSFYIFYFVENIRRMAKKDQKKRDIILSQDNALTTARYKFDLIEKRALYCIIRNIRANYIEQEDGQRTLFENLIITIKEEELQKCGDNTKMKNIYDALKRLRNRDIEINNEKMWLSIGFVNYVKHIKNKSYFEVEVSKEVLPYYVELAQNFTSYSMTVAIALKSTFSQRFYELCCQYRNAGFFFYTVEKLREMFMLEKKYKRGCDFKRRVLDDPQKELWELYNAGQCDLYFEFEPKSYKGKEVTEYKFYVYTRQTEQQKLLEYESAKQAIIYITTTISRFSKSDKGYVKRVVNAVQLHPEIAVQVAQKIQKKFEQYIDKPAKQIGAIIRVCLMEDFGIE